MRRCLTAILLLGGFSAAAFPEIPVESARALGVTKGKSFSEGLVFVNGRFIAPPYVVERWGTGVRINQIPVTGQVVDWTEFLKAQPGVKVERTVTSVEVPVAPEKTPLAPDHSLDDLFDDPPTAGATVPSPPPAPAVKTVQKTIVSYKLEGDFVKNDASRALIAKINAARTEIDRTLRGGGFICFGDRYSRVVGGARACEQLLKELPELQRRSASAAAFRENVRAKQLVFLNESVCDDLYRNKVDYRKLHEHSRKLKKDREWQEQIKPKPLF